MYGLKNPYLQSSSPIQNNDDKAISDIGFKPMSGFCCLIISIRRSIILISY
nr:MAG TPA: hypothetical protein [Caudoviricetes sp.]